jgi:PAS domain S-box-containing protein
MRLKGWGLPASLLAGALLGGGLFAGYLYAHSAGGWGHAPAVVLVSAVVSALAAGCASALTRRRYRRLLRSVADSLAAVRKGPAAHPAGPTDPEAAAAFAEVESLAASYRTALAQVVQMQGQLEEPRRPRANAGGAAAGAGQRPTRLVVGGSAHRLVARLAPSLHFTAVTAPVLEFLGCAGTDLLGRSLLEVAHPEDLPALKQAFAEALKEGEAHDVRFRVRLPVPWVAKAGPADPPQVRYLQMDVMTYHDAAGAPLNLRCHLLDVTERVLTDRELHRRSHEVVEANAQLRRINQDLERLKDSYRDLYHNAPVLYFSLDGHGKLVAFNETMVRTLGYARTELLGQPFARLLPPAARAGYLRDPAALQRPGELETQWVKRDGTVIDVWVGTTTIRDAAGAFVRSRSAALDVTERRRLANALRQKAEELGRANAQLRRINQELEEFTYVVSHDLKEPLRTLEAFSAFLAEDYGPALGEEGQGHIRHLIQASRRLGALIDDLLTLSRAGRVIHTPRPFPWDDAVATALGDLQDLIHRRHADVRVEGPLPAVVGDRGRVVQLLTNLIGNALKYNHSPRPEVVLGHRPPAPGDPPGWATLFVRDNGIGIDPAHHEQIFRIFRRLHRRDEVEGTGAGLAICKKIVEAHGGRIWVDSREGAGATFFFTLPRLPAGAAEPEPDPAELVAAP